MNGRRTPHPGWPALIAAVLALAGCPYSSDFPIGGPAYAVVDAALAGVWNQTREGEELTVTIQGCGDTGYRLTAESENEKESDTYQGFVTSVDGERFLNLQEIPVSAEDRWVLVNYRIERERLRLRLVDDELFEGRSFASSEELRDFIRENLQDPRLYAGEVGQDWDWELERSLP